MDFFKTVLTAAVVGLFWLMVWLVVEDGKQMDAQRAAFMRQCVGLRPAYDCRLQWDTYAAAHNAEIAASVAAGVAVGVAGATAGRR